MNKIERSHVGPRYLDCTHDFAQFLFVALY